MSDGSTTRPPRLTTAGEVTFASASELHASAVWLRQGALLVQADVTPPPLVDFALRLSGGGLEPLAMQARPVTQTGDAVLLQLVDLDEQTLALFAALGDSPPVPPEIAAPAAPEPSTPVAGTPGLAAPQVHLWPEAGGWSSVAAWLPEPPPAPIALPAPAAAPPAVRVVARPVLEQDLLRFVSLLDFDAALPELREAGAVLATCSLDAAAERPILLAAGQYLHPVRLFAQLQPMGRGKAMIEFDDLPALRAELAQIEQATARERATLGPAAGKP